MYVLQNNTNHKNFAPMKYAYLKENTQNAKSDTSKIVIIFITLVVVIINILNAISILF